MLYAYGAYGHIIEPTFSSARLSLLDRGFVYAIAHVRGGQDMGRAWYDDGKMFGKMNTFFDFIDCAEVRRARALHRAAIASSRTAAARAASSWARSRTCGGDLFHAIVADVPFVDVINTMLDASIPLTAQEWEQWGNPAEPAAYAYMRKYSPYDNVRHSAVSANARDERCERFACRVLGAGQVGREAPPHKTDSHPLLLKMNMGAGHGGATGRYERLKEIAFRYAFMIDQTIPKA